MFEGCVWANVLNVFRIFFFFLLYGCVGFRHKNETYSNTKYDVSHWEEREMKGKPKNKEKRKEKVA